MGQLPEGMKDKLKQLIDESKTDEAFTLLQCIHEGDLDQPLRVTLDLTQPQKDFLELFGAENMSGAEIESVMRYFIDTARRGYYQGAASRLMGNADQKPPAKGRRER